MTSDVEQGVEQSQKGGTSGSATTDVDASLMEDVHIDDSKVLTESALPQGKDEQAPQKDTKTLTQRLQKFYGRYEFLILLIVVVLLARAYPPLGAKYLAPKITATWIAVWYIFCKFLRACCSEESTQRQLRRVFS